MVEVGGQTMGTTWSLKAAGGGGSPEVLRQAVQGALDTVVVQMSQWELGSNLTRFNTAPAGSRHLLPAEFAAVLACAVEIAQMTDGAFDPTLGAVTELWGFGSTFWSGALPSAAAAEQARAATGWRRIALEADRSIIQPGGLRLDLSAIAKGFGVDHAAQALLALGVGAFLLEVGGELRGEGLRPDQQPFWVALESPRPAFKTEIRIALPGWSIATSGDYRRGFEAGGRRFGHSFDPATGAPVESGAGPRTISATVLDPSCMRADALATALMVMPAEHGLALANRHQLAALLIVEDDERFDIQPSAAWAAMEA